MIGGNFFNDNDGVERSSFGTYLNEVDFKYMGRIKDCSSRGQEIDPLDVGYLLGLAHRLDEVAIKMKAHLDDANGKLSVMEKTADDALGDLKRFRDLQNG